MIIFKVVFLQTLWAMIVWYGNRINIPLLLATSFLLAIINYFIFSPKISFGKYLFVTTIFTGFGYCHDTGLIWLGIIDGASYSYGYISLWIVFIAYYGDIFNRLSRLAIWILSLMGGIGGGLTYWSVHKIETLKVLPGLEWQYVLFTSLIWAIFFPFSIRLFYNAHFWNVFLDRLVVFSFDKSGYLRHKENFTEDFRSQSDSGKTALVTGGTAGIGEEVGKTLSSLGAKVFVTGRSVAKGKVFEENNPNSAFVALDMEAWSDFDDFCKHSESFDFLVLNAGSMPEKLALNAFGVESQCASQLCGHYFLLLMLKKYGKLKTGARIIWISSGGMYLKKLDLTTLFTGDNYEKVSTYANVKRAQVTLVEELARQSQWDPFSIVSMHPGWVETAGIREALPGFYKLMSGRLRNTAEGADTIIWLLLTKNTPISGVFYFDRRESSPYIHKSFRPSNQQRANLLKRIDLMCDQL